MAVLDDRAVDLRAENAELRRRLEEALAQQQASAEILQLINASPADLAPVFDAMLEKATTLCDAPSGQLAIYDGEFFRFVAAHGDAAHVHDLLARGTMLPVSGTTWPRIVAGELVVHIPDVMESEHYRAGHENTRRFVEVSGGRSLLTVALRKDNVLMGALSVYRRHAQPFTEKQIALLQNFAAQAVIAIENARLFGELRERTADLQESLEYQTATSDVLKVISRTEATLEAALETLVGTAARICAADQGAIHQLHDGLHLVSASFGTNSGYRDYIARNPIAPGRGTAIGRMALEGRMVHIEDVLRDTEYTGGEFQRLAGFRTVLAVPLFREDVVIGSILLTRSRVEPFTDKQIELVRTFADQAVIAIENTRLITETREALEQQTATAEVLGVINASPGDLAPVFDAMLERAMRLCDAAFGTLSIFDGHSVRTAATRGVPAEFAKYRMANPPVYGPGTGYARLVAGEAIIHNIDLKAEAPYRDGEPNRRALVDLGGARTSLQVALRKDDALLGGIVIYRQEVRPFSDKQIALLQNFAAQAVIAMENARLITETREALEQQTATAEVLGVINSSPGDLAPVFDAMLEKAMRLCTAAFGYLETYDGETFSPVAWRGLPARYAEYLPRRDRPETSGSYAQIVGGAPFVHVADLMEGEGYHASPLRKALVDLGGARTSILVALRRDESLLGSLVIYRQEVRPFSNKQIALLQNFAAQAVIAIENTRLITETREALEQQTATAEVLGVINASPGDLAPVFDAILEKAHRLCGVSHGSLQLYEDGRFRAVATRGVTAEAASHLRQSREPGPAAKQLLAGARFHEIADQAPIAPSPTSARSGRLDWRTEGIVGRLFVPLRQDAALLGMIVAGRAEARPFSGKEIALLENFAAQAVIAMENARLLTETREALEQQTATAEMLQVINSSPGDLTPVFDAILEKAHALCGVACGSLELYDGENFRAVATIGFSDEFVEIVRQGYPGVQSPDTRALIEGQRYSHILDLAETDSAITRRAVEIEGHRTLLCVPLRRDGQLLGMIASTRKEVRAFSDKEIALLENFAAQAVIAMENARLITETREALEQQTATAEVLGVINSSPGDLSPVFDAMLDKALTLCEASLGTLYNCDGELFHCVGHRGVSTALADFLREPIRPRAQSSGSFHRLLLGATVIHDPDIRDSEAYRDGFRLRRALVDLDGARTGLWVALRKDNVFLGTFVIYRREVRPFSEKQIALLQNFAAQAVIAMENARLLGELRQRTEEVAELNRGLEARVAEQVEELGRVGRLKRFLAPQLAELIVSQGDENILESHRREIVVVFCDLRGFTAFAETAEPEEVLDLLREYHAALGPLVGEFEGTLDHFSGDGIMVFFNDPVPCPDPAERAVKMAVAMRAAANELVAAWRRRGRDLGFGVGIAQGYATLGQIGFADRSDYTAIGTVCNLAARLCAEATDGQILLARRVAGAVEATVALEELGTLSLKGLAQPVAAFNVRADAPVP